MPDTSPLCSVQNEVCIKKDGILSGQQTIATCRIDVV